MTNWISNGNGNGRQKTLLERQQASVPKVDLKHLYDKPTPAPAPIKKNNNTLSNLLSGFLHFANTPIQQSPLKVNLTPAQLAPKNVLPNILTTPHDTYNKVLNSQGQFNDSANQHSDFMNKVNAATQHDIKAIPAYRIQQDKQQAKDNALIKNPFLKGLARTSQSAGNMMTFGNGVQNQIDTGNKAVNFLTDTLGSVGGAMINPMGIGDTLYSGASKFVGNPLQNALAKKIGTNTVAKRFIPGVVGNAGTMAAINAGLEAPQAKNIKDVGKAALSGAAQGALFGSALGGLKEGNFQLNKAVNNLGIDKIIGNADLGTRNKIEPKFTPETVIKKGNTNVPVKAIPSIKQAITKPVIQYKPNDEFLLNNEGGKINSINGDGTYNATIYKADGEHQATVQADGENMKQVFKNTTKDQLNMDQRTTENVGNQKIKAYQTLHPETSIYIQNEAKILKGELDSTKHGGFELNQDELGNNVGRNTPRVSTPTIASILDEHKATYQEISDSLDKIANGTGKDALSKKIEMKIHDRLIYGYQDGQFDVPANENYKSLINNIENPEKTSYSNVKIEKPTPINNNLEVSQKEIRQTQRDEVSAEPLKDGEVPTKLSMNVVSGDKKAKTGLITKIGNGLNKFYTHVVDKNKAISDFSKDANKQGGDSETYIKATNAANVSTKVSHIMDQGLRDSSGKNIIGVSFKKLVQSMPKNKTDFINYLLQNHNIDRSIEDKAIDSNFSASQSHQAVLKILQDHPEFEAKGKEFTSWINKFMGEYGNKSGLISDDLWKNLNETYKNYLPTNRDFTDIEGVNPATNGKGFTGQNMPVKKLSTNTSSRDIVDPYESVMNTINRTVRGATNNDVAQSMLKDIQANPEGMKKWGEVIPEDQKVNPNVNNVVTVLDKGQKVNVQINDINLLKSLEGFQKGGDHPYQNAMKKITNPYKALITTKNPLFTVRNMARDLPSAYVNGSEHNPVKFGINYIKAAKDLLTNNETAQQYNSVGGGGSNFDFNGDNATKSLKNLTKKTNVFTKLSRGIEKINNTVESTPRLAEYKNSLKKGNSIDKALYDANELTTNFSRGGDLTKAIDSGVPYLNASVQGLDKIVRQFKDHPVGTVAKGLISVTIPTMVLNNMNKDNPNYQALDNRTKDNYYLFPNPGGNTFTKIPKSREIGVVFGSLAERLLRANNGEANAFKGFGGLNGTIATNFAPTNPLENNLLSPIISGLGANKDFAGRTIVSQALQNRSPSLQYDETTSEIAKKFGELTNLSPKKIDYIIKSYTGVIGQIGLPAATKQNYTGDTKSNLLKPIETSFTADPLYSNQDVTDFYDNLDKATKVAADNNFTNNVDPSITTDQEYARSALSKNATKMSDMVKAATVASQAGDDTKARVIRQQMVDLAKSSNADIGNEPNGKILDSISAVLKDNNGDEAKALRQKVTAIKDQSKASTISDVDMRAQLSDLRIQAQNTSMPTTEFTKAISASLLKNTSKQATALRKEVTQITTSNLSVKEQRDKLQPLLQEAANAPVKRAKARKKKTVLNPFDK